MANPLLQKGSTTGKDQFGKTSTYKRRKSRRRSQDDYDSDYIASIRTPFTSQKKRWILYLLTPPGIMFIWMAFQIVDRGMVGENTMYALIIAVSCACGSIALLRSIDSEDWHNEDNYVLKGREEEDEDE